MREELFRQRMGLRDYKIIAPENVEEKMSEWSTLVNEILVVISADDFDDKKLYELLVDKKDQLRDSIAEAMPAVIKKIESRDLDKDDKILLAIGLWIARDRGSWQAIRSVAKLIFGSEYKIEEVLDKSGAPNCIDTSVLEKAMAAKFGITGQVISKNNRKLDHHWFQTDSGKILDIWWGNKAGLLFKDEDDFFSNRQVPDAKHSCGSFAE